MCVYRRSRHPAHSVLGSLEAFPIPLGSGAAPPPPPPFGAGSPPLPAGAHLCTTTFTGAANNNWGSAANWTLGIPSTPVSYGCIAAGYPQTVLFSTAMGAPTEIGGVSAENPEGLTLQDGDLTLSSPEEPSIINNLRPGAASVTLKAGVLLQLTGTSQPGGTAWTGPGTLVIDSHFMLKTGDCPGWSERWAYLKCATTAQPTPAAGGLRIENYGEIVGSGISLCGTPAAPTQFDNWGFVNQKDSGGFLPAAGCSVPGAVVNHKSGRIAVAAMDGQGCNVAVAVAALINEGFLHLGSCIPQETEQNHRAKLEIDSSLTQVGRIDDEGDLRIHGDYTPSDSAELTLGIKETEFDRHGTETTNLGTMKIWGSARLAGLLNIATYSTYAPPLGKAFQVITVETGTLTGEFALGERCIPAEPGVGYNVLYQPGLKGGVTLEVAQVAGC